MTKENASQRTSRTGLYIGIVIIIIAIVIAGAFAYQYTQPSSNPTPSPSPTGTTKSITIYGGNVDQTTFGFGETSTSVTSPGPTLTFKVGDVVTVTFHNTSPSAPHNVAFVTQKADGNEDLAFPNAQVASRSSPISAGGNATATFTVTQAGSFYYICQVGPHVTKGMWGNVVVNP